MRHALLIVCLLAALCCAVDSSARSSSSNEYSNAINTFKRDTEAKGHRGRRHGSDEDFSDYTATEEDTEDYEREAALDKECAWTRQDVFDCIKRHAVDVDEDGRMDAKEVSIFKKKLVGAFANWVSDKLTAIAHFFSPHSWLAKYTVPEILHRCGDEDGYITVASFQSNKRRCLKHCRDWERMMDLCTKLDKHPHEYKHE